MSWKKKLAWGERKRRRKSDKRSSTTHTEKNLSILYIEKKLNIHDYIYPRDRVIDLFESESQTYKGNCRICFNIFFLFNIHISLMLDKKKKYEHTFAAVITNSKKRLLYRRRGEYVKQKSISRYSFFKDLLMLLLLLFQLQQSRAHNLISGRQQWMTSFSSVTLNIISTLFFLPYMQSP